MQTYLVPIQLHDFQRRVYTAVVLNVANVFDCFYSIIDVCIAQPLRFRVMFTVRITDLVCKIFEIIRKRLVVVDEFLMDKLDGQIFFGILFCLFVLDDVSSFDFDVGVFADAML